MNDAKMKRKSTAKPCKKVKAEENGRDEHKPGQKAGQLPPVTDGGEQQPASADISEHLNKCLSQVLHHREVQSIARVITEIFEETKRTH